MPPRSSAAAPGERPRLPITEHADAKTRPSCRPQAGGGRRGRDAAKSARALRSSGLRASGSSGGTGARMRRGLDRCVGVHVRSRRLRRGWRAAAAQEQVSRSGSAPRLRASRPGRAGGRPPRPKHRFSEKRPHDLSIVAPRSSRPEPSALCHLPGDDDPRCGGERSGHVSSRRHFAAAQRVPTASGQDGAAQPPPRACGKGVVRTRSGERRRGLTLSRRDADSPRRRGSQAVRIRRSGSGAALRGLLTPGAAASRVSKL